jgi:PAS domain S-box-containing protein
MNAIRVAGINIEWHPQQGTCTFDGLPVAMMWVDTTLAGLMSGLQAMVGTERFILALQGEGRKSVEADWRVMSKFPDFRRGFEAIAEIAAVAGWGQWSLAALDEGQKECRFRVTDGWEGRFQKALGVCWGSGMVAGKLAGYCSKLFGTNCWADQTAFDAGGDKYDEFLVRPSTRSVEKEIDSLLATDEATRADMAVALRKLEREIAERQRVGEALRESEAKFRSLVETTSDWIWETSADGTYTYSSPAVRVLLGYEPGDLIGMTPFDFMPADEAERVAAEFFRIRSERRAFFNLENRNLHKDGHIVVLETSGVPRFDRHGNLLGYRGIDRDISERKKAEEALLQKEEFIRALLDTSRDWIWAIDLHGVHTYSNPAIRTILGYDVDEVVGRTSFALMHEEDRHRVEAEVRRAISTRRGWSNLVVRWRHKDGGYRFLESNSVPVLDAGGLVTGFRGVDRDISERTLAEAERMEMERRLLHAQKLESLGVLAGGIAHDFNNLLMAISGNLDLALLDSSSPSGGRPHIEHALQATRRAVDLTRQMLAYSGKASFVIAPMDINNIVRENSNLFRTTISRNVRIDLELTEADSTIEADPGQVQQVIMNLITNASEAIGENAGVIRLCTGVEEFDDAYLNESRLSEKPPAGRYAYVEVSDTGSGMDDETRHRLFDPFFSTKFIGRGLGMSTVLGIVRGHRGAIMVQSAIGQGSTIRVLFPALEAAIRAPTPDSVGHPLPSAEGSLQGTVLVVDDEEGVRDVCVAFVQRLGLRAMAAADGAEGLALFTRHKDEIGCILLDLTMPQMDGISTFREIRRLRPDVPVLLCSGYDEQEATHHFAGEGLTGFIQKPFGLQDLRNKLEPVLCRV